MNNIHSLSKFCQLDIPLKCIFCCHCCVRGLQRRDLPTRNKKHVMLSADAGALGSRTSRKPVITGDEELGSGWPGGQLVDWRTSQKVGTFQDLDDSELDNREPQYCWEPYILARAIMIA